MFVKEVERASSDTVHWVRREATFALGALAKVVPTEVLYVSLVCQGSYFIHLNINVLKLLYPCSYPYLTSSVVTPSQSSEFRFYSRFLALQIQGEVRGVLPEAYRETPTTLGEELENGGGSR